MTHATLDGGTYPVAVVGGGHAGLAMSYCLAQRGLDHVVMERERVGHVWRTQRWDTFCLVTPNWQCRLPGFPYPGDDPDGFMARDEIVAYVEDYAAFVDPPLHEGVEVSGLAQDDDGFELTTSAGLVRAEQVVVATGGYHRPIIPRMAERLPADIVQVHSSRYRNPGQLPDGDVLVVGSGQSGAQIAEDLHLAGRRVHLCTGGAPRVSRRYRDRDVVAWLDDMGYYDMPVHEHPNREGVRAQANHYVTGRDGGHAIDLRAFALDGMQLYGRLVGIDGGTLRFADDLRKNLDHADEVLVSINRTIDEYIAECGIDAPPEPAYEKCWEPETETTELALTAVDLAAVVWCLGLGTDFRWIDAPAFTGGGYPSHVRGLSSVPGLYFLGLPWLYTWGSGRFSGVGRDAEFIADRVHALSTAAQIGRPTRRRNPLALGY